MRPEGEVFILGEIELAVPTYENSGYLWTLADEEREYSVVVVRLTDETVKEVRIIEIPQP